MPARFVTHLHHWHKMEIGPAGPCGMIIEVVERVCCMCPAREDYLQERVGDVAVALEMPLDPSHGGTIRIPWGPGPGAELSGASLAQLEADFAALAVRRSGERVTRMQL